MLFDCPKLKHGVLRMGGWKMNFLFGMAYVQGRTVSFRDGIKKESSKVVQFRFIFDSMDPIYLPKI